jgi:predicted RNA binding protein YcfA (HicA-like mRNA interferase family)
MSSKLPSLKPREVIKVLEKLGFVFVRQKGSHPAPEQSTVRGSPEPCFALVQGIEFILRGNIGITIPYHNKDLKKGTLRAIIKQTGLSVEEFLKLSRHGDLY